ncbi:MAG: hypothetical protein IKD76_03050 [Clostridia bacterium]|nr:hypothetical protein [Clostridia bacterium]
MRDGNADTEEIRNKYKRLGESYKEMYEDEIWKVDPVFIGMFINSMRTKDNNMLLKHCRDFIIDNNSEKYTVEGKELYQGLIENKDSDRERKFYKWIEDKSDSEIEKEVKNAIEKKRYGEISSYLKEFCIEEDSDMINEKSREVSENVQKEKLNERGNEEFYKWLVDRFVENNVLHSITEADVMLLEWKKKDATKILADLMSRKLNEIKVENSDVIEDEKTKIIMDKKATNSAENAENTIEEVKKIRKENPEKNIDKLVVVSDWRFLIRQYLTTQKKAEEANIDNLRIMGYPGQKEGREGSKIKYKCRVDFARFALRELWKIAEYDDVGDAPILEDIRSLRKGRPDVYIDGKEFGEVIEADINKARKGISSEDSDNTTR